jgi:DNA-binding NtrC family response regulator
VRELRNLIERFVVLENAEIIQTKHLPMWLLDQQTTPLSTDRASDNKFILPESGISLENVEKDLRRSKGRIIIKPRQQDS